MSSDTGPRRIVDASLLRATIEQFAERSTHPIGDIVQFERLALGLIDIVDAETVANLTRPLCFNSETPPAIYARLYDKGGPCARLALEYAPSIPRAELLANAEHGPADFALAIARRRDLDREIVLALASRGERGILRGLAANRAAHLDTASRRALAQSARDDYALARLLLDRGDLQIDPEPLFLAATRLERVAIILNACRRALTGGRMETRRADPEFTDRMTSAADSGNRDAMAGLLADALDCRKDRVRAILLDTHGDALALTLLALGIDINAATRILLCAGPSISHDVDRLRALRALMRSTPQRAAASIIASITGVARTETETETPRRGGPREETLAGIGWRRRPTRATTVDQRKRDQSA